MIQGSCFGDLLKTFRKQKRISQHALAEKLGVHRNTIWSWEQGVYLPDGRGMVIELARQLRLDERQTRELLEASLTAVASYWQVPFTRNPFFTGREQVLAHLHTVLTQQSTSAALTQSYAVHGLGGIGKTQLAVEYAYQHRYDYNAVLWVQAETQSTLTASFVAFADLLVLSEKSEEDQSKIVLAVLRWLNRHKGWLLIFDNVEDPSLLKPFLPATGGQGALLFTARLQSLGTLAQTVELSPMTHREGLDFLLARTQHPQQSEECSPIDPQELAAARRIVDEMGGLPLALEQAGAYIDATKCSLSDYLHLFQTARNRLLDEHEATSDHPLSVTRTFTLAFEHIEQYHPLAAELLTVCAFLAPEAIPDLFFLAGAAHLGSTFEAMAADPLAFHEGIRTLLSYSLLQRHAADHTVTVHRLVQMVLRGQLSEAERRTWTRRVIEAMSRLFPFDEDMQTEYWQMCERLLPHALLCIIPGERPNEDQECYISLMNHVATYLSKRARYSEAEPLFVRAAQMGEQALGPLHPLVAEALDGQADIAREQSRYSEAEPLLLRALHIREQTLGAEDCRTATSFDRLAHLSWRQGKYQEAELLYQRALSIWEQALGPQHPRIASPLNGLGLLYWQQGRYAQAEPFYQRSLRIWEQALGPDHPQVAYPLNNLGSLYIDLARYEQAERMLLRALRIKEQMLGPEHPQLAYPLTNLGILYIEQGKYEQSETVLLRALRICEQAAGSLHPLTFPLLYMANLYREQGKYEQAKPFYQRALRIREQVLGPDHPDVAFPLEGLANLYREQGKYAQAEPLYQRAQMLLQQHLDSQHPDLAEFLHDLARFYHVQQQTTKALSLYQQALTIREKALGPHHPKTRATRSAYVQLLRDLGREEDAAAVDIQRVESTEINT